MGRAIIILNRGKSEPMQGLPLLSCPGGASASLVQVILFPVENSFAGIQACPGLTITLM